MKKFLKALLLIPGIICSLSFHNAFHPFYLSVTEFELKKATHTAQLSSRVFTDDLQQALHLQTGKNIQLRQQTPDNKALLESYMKEHLKVWINKKPLNLVWLGYEVREESVWCYFESTVKGNETSVAFDNTLLCGSVSTQSNIIHCTLGDKRESYRLICPESRVTFPL